MCVGVYLQWVRVCICVCGWYYFACVYCMWWSVVRREKCKQTTTFVSFFVFFLWSIKIVCVVYVCVVVCKSMSCCALSSLLVGWVRKGPLTNWPTHTLQWSPFLQTQTNQFISVLPWLPIRVFFSFSLQRSDHVRIFILFSVCMYCHTLIYYHCVYHCSCRACMSSIKLLFHLKKKLLDSAIFVIAAVVVLKYWACRWIGVTAVKSRN